MKPKSSEFNHPLATPTLKTFVLDLYSERVFAHEICPVVPPLFLPTSQKLAVSSSAATQQQSNKPAPKSLPHSRRTHYASLLGGFPGISCELRGELSYCIDSFFAANSLSTSGKTTHLVVGALSDPLSPSPRQLPSWLEAFELMIGANPFHLTLQTRSALALLLLPLFRNRLLQTSVTIALESLERGIAAAIAPGSAPPFERIQLVKTLVRLGVQTTIQIAPCIRKGSTRRECRKIVQAISELGCGIRVVPVSRISDSTITGFSADAHLVLQDELDRKNVATVETWPNRLEGSEAA